MNEVLQAVKHNTLKPFLNASSGILLKVLRPFKEGDFIEIDGQLGSVVKKGLSQTTITNLDGLQMVIDNVRFYSRSLHNLSTKNIIRLDLCISICYDEDMSRAKESILSFLSLNKKILNTPAPKLQVSKLKDRFVEISIEPWCLLDDFMEIDQELEDQLTLHLTRLGFEIEVNELEYNTIGVTA